MNLYNADSLLAVPIHAILPSSPSFSSSPPSCNYLLIVHNDHDILARNLYPPSRQMAQSPLHGLNLVHHDDSYHPRQHDLLSTPSVQEEYVRELDVWTNLTFQSDESLSKEDSLTRAGASTSSTDSPTIDDDKDDDQDPEGPANPESHANVVNAIAVSQLQDRSGSFDVGSVLAGFGIDPFLVPPVAAPQQPHSASLAQLLSSYPFSQQQQSQQPHNAYGQHLRSSSAAQPTPQLQSAEPEAGSSGPIRRGRARKSTLISPTASPTDSSSLPPGSPHLSMAEDKRRRNTAASARFRAKKKEREVALERRSKDLEGRVSELERECEQLRRENGWLMGLVVGVTGSGGTVPGLPTSSTATGKRKRDEEEKS